MSGDEFALDCAHHHPLANLLLSLVFLCFQYLTFHLWDTLVVYIEVWKKWLKPIVCRKVKGTFYYRRRVP